jgi:phosphohistidine phosphatase
MPFFVLMRHAHAQHTEPGMRDFDRPLSQAGYAEANSSLKLFQATGLQITKVFCSPSRRTKDTLACVRQTIPINDGAIIIEPSLYSGEVTAYQNLGSTIPPDDVAMFIGHNPMIERFAFDLAKTGDQVLLNKLKFGFPTAGLAVFEIANTSREGRLIHFFTAN